VGANNNVNIGLPFSSPATFARRTLTNLAKSNWPRALQFAVGNVKRPSGAFMAFAICVMNFAATLQAFHGLLAVMPFIHFGIFPFVMRHMVLLGQFAVFAHVPGRTLKFGNATSFQTCGFGQTA
jgi:hypothetical protein